MINQPMTDANPRSRRAELAIVFTVALMLRAAFGFVVDGGIDAQPRFDDARWYWSMARSLDRGDGLVGEFGHRAERLPLYPGFLAIFAGGEHSLALARVAQWFIGSLATVAVFLLGQRLGDRHVGWAAALIVAADPALVAFSSLLLTETLYVTSIALLWLIVWPLRNRECNSAGRWAAAGVFSAMCVYVRESALLIVAAMAVYLVIVRLDWRAMLGSASIVALVVLSLIPWGYRNKQVLGQWVFLTTRGGISLYDGVRPGATGASDLADVKNSPAVRDLTETEWNQHFIDQSWEAIQADPARVAKLAITKLGRTWSPVPNASDYQSTMIRVIFAAWYVPLYILALCGIWVLRRKWQVWAGLLLPVICISAVHAVFVGSMRYRLAALPCLAILAAVGLICLKRLYRS